MRFSVFRFGPFEPPKHGSPKLSPMTKSGGERVQRYPRVPLIPTRQARHVFARSESSPVKLGSNSGIFVGQNSAIDSALCVTHQPAS
jgi:hypothetical protein